MSSIVNIQGLFFVAVCAAAAIAAALMLKRWHAGRAARLKRKTLPRWPLTSRAVTSTKQRIAWHWMTQTFFDHAVMIKLPVTRFLLPQTLQQGRSWYELLGNVYCTFTLVDAAGNVVGCVDVASALANTKRAQSFKRSLLSECAIAYAVIDPQFLPDAVEIRADFLGACANERPPPKARAGVAVNAASEQLRASLMKQRLIRNSDRMPLSPAAELHGQLPPGVEGDDTHGAYGWQHRPFLMPVDSRTVRL